MDINVSVPSEAKKLSCKLFRSPVEWKTQIRYKSVMGETKSCH